MSWLALVLSFSVHFMVICKKIHRNSFRHERLDNLLTDKGRHHT